ncbi:ZFP36L1 [Branchiostoma lanceolatum]|uniref:ZFP36L1 protein n=2 Tax=Branchiostoma lanceolatum TaxID=7740 RepID=A0A8J9YUD7_BRALA|nr:ZFP36L1 [Branchiostoma lanceolatum]
MIGFGPQASSGNPPTFVRPPTPLSLPSTQCARPPNPVEYLPHITAAQHRFLPPSSIRPLMYPGNVNAQSAPRPPNQPAFLPHPFPIHAYPVTVVTPNVYPNVQISGANQQCPVQVQGHTVTSNNTTVEPHPAMEPRFPAKNVRTRPLRHRPVTYQPFVLPIPVQHPPPSRYPPPMQQQSCYTPQAGQFPPTSVPPPASYQSQSFSNTAAYSEPDCTSGQTGSNWGAGWEDWEVTELKKSLYREFATLLGNHGPLGERDQPVLGLFMGMPTEARQLIKESGGVKAFLLQSPRFSEEGGKIFLSQELRPRVTVSSADSGQGSWENNAGSSRPTSGINPNAMEFIPTECSFSEGSSDDVFVEGETYGSEEPDSESTFKEIASAYGIKVTRPEDYSLEDYSLEGVSEVSLPEAMPKTGPCESAQKGSGDMVNSEGMGGAEHTFEASWVVWDEDKNCDFSQFTSRGGNRHWSTVTGQTGQLDSSLALPTNYENKDDCRATAAVELVGVENSEPVEEIATADDEDFTSDGAVSVPKTDGEVNMPESITEDGVTDGETAITENASCSCGPAVDFPTFHEETVTVEQSLDTFFQELELNKDSNIDEQEHDDSYCQANSNENNNNVDKQPLTDQSTECETKENVDAEHVIENSMLREKLCQAELTEYNLRQELNQTKAQLDSNLDKMIDYERELENVEEHFDRVIQEAIKKYTIKMEARMKETEDNLDETTAQANEKVAALQKELETANKEITAKESAAEKSRLKHADVEKELKERLELVAAQLYKSVQQNSSQGAAFRKQIHDLQEKVTSVQEELETAKKELKMKESALEKAHSQHAAVERELTERLELTQVRLQKSLQKYCSQDVPEDEQQMHQLQEKVIVLQWELESVKKELKTKESAAKMSRLQLEAVEKALTEKLQQYSSQDVTEELKKTKEFSKEIEMKVQAALEDQRQMQRVEVGLRVQLIAAKKEMEVKELAGKKACLQITAVLKELTERLQQTGAELYKSLQQNCSQDAAAKKQIQQLQEKVTALQEELETTKKERTIKESAAEKAHLQLAAVEKELTERLQRTEAQLQKSLQQNCSQDVQEELPKAQERATQTELQLAAVEKEMTEKLQFTEAQLQKICSQHDPEALKKFQEWATQEVVLSLQQKKEIEMTLQANTEELTQMLQEKTELQEKAITALQEELEIAKKELKAKEYAVEKAQLQLAVVEKELKEKLQLSEARLQKSLQDFPEELTKVQERATQAELQLAAVRKDLTEKLRLTEARLQKSLQDFPEELTKVQERATQAELQLAAVRKDLTEKLRLTEAWLQKSLQDFPEKLTKVQERATQAELQLAAVRKDLTEKLRLTEAWLQKSLQDFPEELTKVQQRATQAELQLAAVKKELSEKQQQNCSHDVPEELTKAWERATQAELQLAAVKKELTEKQQQNCSHDVPEELTKARERATQAELQVLNFTFRWCRSELEEQYREGEKMYRFFTERCRLGERELEKFCCNWQDYTSDILKQITHVQLLYSNNVQKLQSGQQLSSLPQLSLVRPRMPHLPDLTADILSPPDSYKLHLVPLCPVVNQSSTGSTNPSVAMPTGDVDWSTCIAPPQPLQDNNSTPDVTSPQEAGNENQQSDQHGSLLSDSKTSSTQDRKSPTQEKRSPDGDVQPPPKAKVSEDKQRLRLPSGISKAASVASGAVSKRRTRTESGSSCGSNVTEASVASVAGSPGPPGLINLQEPMIAHSTSTAKSVNKSPHEKSQKAAKTSVEPCKSSAGNKDSHHPETSQSGSSQTQGNQSASMVQGAAGQPPCLRQIDPQPAYQNVACHDQPAGYLAAHPMGFVQSAAFPLVYAGQQAFSVPRQVPLGAGLQFVPDVHQFSSTPPGGVFEFAGHHQVSPIVLQMKQGVHPQVQPGAHKTAEPPASLQPKKALLETPASFSTKTTDDQKTTSFTQAVRPKSTIPSHKARALAQQARTEDALDTQNKYQALDSGTEDTTEEIQETTHTPEAKKAAENSSADETVRKVMSPVSQLSNVHVQQLSNFPEIEDINNTDDEWQMQLSKKKRKVLAAVKESEVPPTGSRTVAKQKLLDRLHADLPGYSKEQLVGAAAAVRRARHGTLSSLPFCVISTMVKAELYKSQSPAQAETSNQPSALTPPSNQVQATPSSQVQATPSNQPGTPPGDHATTAPLSTEAQSIATVQSCEPPSCSKNEIMEATEGNLQLARSLLQLKYKTEMCSNFRSSGTCRFGDKCLYAHGERELRRTPKLTPCSAMQQKGHCPHGDGCIFAHSKNDQKGSAKTPEKSRPVTAVRTRTSPTARMRLVDLKKKKEQIKDRFDERRPLWQTLETKQPPQSLEADVCAICVDDLYDLTGSCVRTLDCGHRFHDSCVSRWLLKEERTCPCCRQLALLPEEFPRLK